MSAFLRGACLALLPLLAVLSLVDAALIDFQNCLEASILFDQPLQLQFIPLFYDATFDTAFPNHLNVTIYGNVSGQQVTGPYPPPSSPKWSDPTVKFGKIANIGSSGNYSTLFADFDVLSYSAYSAPASRFCAHVDGSCPLGPRFNVDASNRYDLAAFSVVHDFGSPYHFSTFASTIRVISGDIAKQSLACVSANITPALGSGISDLITWLPAAILIMKGVATLVAAIKSPWAGSDIFRWSSNYGRDEDLLRLVTPGFGDCLQYIQFVTLMGSLTLQYPGFFQPAVSQTAWSLLLFNQSWVTHGPGTQSLVDGIYVVNGTYGISAMRQLIGMTDSIDVWACMAIWLAVIAAMLVLLCQVGFFAGWLYRIISKTSKEDLRRKNVPFTLGNMIRLLFNFFILPIVSLSLFQLVISPRSPTSVVASAAVLLAILIICAAWILRVIFSANPRTKLFDDMPTVLLYGPLYNTYSDSTAPFALVPVLITFLRGVAFGAAQPSGAAQIVLLAICEVILIITLNGFRPFQNQTSMNAYHTFFSAVRLITVLLCIAFLPSLGVTEAPKGWVGYVILILHACVLVFGFFLNSAQTLVEVIARSAGLAGREAQTGEARGSILSWRMLKKRQDRPAAADRASLSSNAAMLQTQEGRDQHSRSISASSQQLLNQANATPNTNRLSGFENFPNGGDADKGFIYVPGPSGQGAMHGNRQSEAYYRPPRRRTMTIDALTPGAKSRSVGSADLLYQEAAQQASAGATDLGRESPAPAFFRDRADSGAGTTRTDYAVREVDQYYRGPALSEQPTRKLKTGPADPEGPAKNAQSWFQRLFTGLVGGKKEKDEGKGFEVVRSSRMPPEMQRAIGTEEGLEMEEQDPSKDDEPYRDSPETHQSELQAAAGAERPVDLRQAGEGRGVSFNFDSTTDGTSRAIRSDSATARAASAAHQRDPMHPGMRAEQPSRHTKSVDVGLGYITRNSGETTRSSRYDDNLEDGEVDTAQFSHGAPALGPIDTGGNLDVHFPSRFSSQSSSANRGIQRPEELPPLPNRSPRRNSGSFPNFDSSAVGPYGTHLGTGTDVEQTSSSFNTSHHRAADSITRNSFGANAALKSSSAEFVAGSPPAQSGFNGGR